MILNILRSFLLLVSFRYIRSASLAVESLENENGENFGMMSGILETPGKEPVLLNESFDPTHNKFTIPATNSTIKSKITENSNDTDPMELISVKSNLTNQVYNIFVQKMIIISELIDKVCGMKNGPSQYSESESESDFSYESDNNENLIWPFDILKEYEISESEPIVVKPSSTAAIQEEIKTFVTVSDPEEI